MVYPTLIYIIMAVGFVNTTIQHSLHYGDSLYWVVTTMTTTGYGDISATSVLEMLYASVVMVLGKLLFGFILGSIASTLANLETPRVMFDDKLSAVKASDFTYQSTIFLPNLSCVLCPSTIGVHEGEVLLS